MRHTQCLLTPARALHRVLLLELANTASTSNGVSSTVLSSPPAFRKHASLPTSKHARSPAIASTSPCCRVRAFSTTSPAAAAHRRMIIKKNPRDKDIPYRWVRIADGSNTLSAPQRTDVAIANLPPGHSLMMVAPPPPPDAAAAAAPGSQLTIQPAAAICRIVDAVAEAAAKKEAAKESKKLAQQTKTLELNWAIAPHDLAHKMKRLGEFLSKGMRVEILLARKRGSRKASQSEGEELVRRIQEAASHVPGTTEYKKMDGFVGNVVKMFFEGPKDKKKAESSLGEGSGSRQLLRATLKSYEGLG
ncbi:hypothetical protein F4801DRAFT_487193 [Xylaria longipes]|nr:hypothetical protein F4801DRAFT_487193 [Xylaria longipes]